ncbi:MAG: TerB family tellurite resistance protein [Congregibacter sp.]
MINTLRKIFTQPAGDDGQSADETRKLAAAALLIEVARADFTQDAAEEAAMADLLTSSLQLDRASVDKLLEQAGESVDEATSLYEFTRLVNDHYSYEDKYALITSMWKVAFADNTLNKYEEHLIRRVADLIYVTHEDFIQGKLAARADT